ncbi:MAG: hypothetical protein AAB791_01635 [Patescibacteria group bacterium]
MLISAKDIFWIVLSFVILWIGIFLGWSAYYIAMILRDVKKTTGSFRKKMDLIEQILEMIKKKVDSTANYLPPLIEGAGKLVEHFRDKKKKKK